MTTNCTYYSYLPFPPTHPSLVDATADYLGSQCGAHSLLTVWHGARAGGGLVRRKQLEFRESVARQLTPPDRIREWDAPTNLSASRAGLRTRLYTVQIPAIGLIVHGADKLNCTAHTHGPPGGGRVWRGSACQRRAQCDH